MKQHKESAGFKQRIEETRPFYQSLWDELDTVYGYELIDLNFANAYNIFDLLNVASIHNASHNGTVSDEALTQLRTLADKWKYGMAYNIEDSARSISGQAFAGGVLQQPDQIVSSQGKLKFSQLAGSYDAFLAFFILSNLTAVSDDFYGLPDYASTMAFELFATEDITSFPSDEASLRVRFVFQNGSTEGDVPQAYPLFASGERVTFVRRLYSEDGRFGHHITTAMVQCLPKRSTVLRSV
jgi:hypothetical protein